MQTERLIQTPGCWDPCAGDVFWMLRNGALLHNNGLMYISTLPNFKDFNFDKSWNASLEFCTSAYPTINVSNIITKERARFYFAKLQELTNTDRQNEFPSFLYNEGLINNLQKEYFELVINTVIALQDKSPIMVPSAMAGIQNVLLARTGISQSDRNVMDAISAIAIATMNFWYDALTNKNNPWHSVAQGSNLPNWLKKGLADLGGFVVGFVVGSALGGPAVGTAGGTLVGQACSSGIKAE